MIYEIVTRGGHTMAGSKGFTPSRLPLSSSVGSEAPGQGSVSSDNIAATASSVPPPPLYDTGFRTATSSPAVITSLPSSLHTTSLPRVVKSPSHQLRFPPPPVSLPPHRSLANSSRMKSLHEVSRLQSIGRRPLTSVITDTPISRGPRLIQSKQPPPQLATSPRHQILLLAADREVTLGQAANNALKPTILKG